MPIYMTICSIISLTCLAVGLAKSVLACYIGCVFAMRGSICEERQIRFTRGNLARITIGRMITNIVRALYYLLHDDRFDFILFIGHSIEISVRVFREDYSFLGLEHRFIGAIGRTCIDEARVRGTSFLAVFIGSEFFCTAIVGGGTNSVLVFGGFYRGDLASGVIVGGVGTTRTI